MGFLDTVITNIQRAAGDVIEAPRTAFQEGVSALQEGVQGGLSLLSPLLGAAGPLGEQGPTGPEGVTTIINVGGPGQPRSSIQGPVRDLSTFKGGHWSGGNGVFATRTLVERLEISTGLVSVVSLKPGSPHLMNSDIQAAKKVFRNVAALNKRLPRKTVKESETTKLKNAAVASAIANVQAHPQVCAPKC